VYMQLLQLQHYSQPAAARGACSLDCTSTHLCGDIYMRVGMVRMLANSFDFGLLDEQSSQKRRFTVLDRATMNRRAKFDAASFILGGEIRNRTNTHQKNKQTHRQTVYVDDISTHCLLPWYEGTNSLAVEDKPARHAASRQRAKF